MRVKPIIQCSLVAGALALPVTAWPLGLGRLMVESYVGQPLSARIELLSASKEDLDTLSAKVADPSLYRQNNLTYQGALSRARVSLERGPGDTVFLRVTSPTPITEPYLDLLVEANWAAGRVVRDYTFLLDPPGAPLASVDPVTPAREGTAPVARAPATSAASGTPSQRSSARPSGTGRPRGQGGDTYEVKRGDSLSKIAKEYKPETATLDQMLVALFKSNAARVRGQQHEPPALGRDHHDPERRRCHRSRGHAAGSHAHRAGADQRLAFVSRSCRGCRAHCCRRTGQSCRRRQYRHRGAGTYARRSPRQRPVARVQGRRLRPRRGGERRCAVGAAARGETAGSPTSRSR